jgi:hypothetical protein
MFDIYHCFSDLLPSKFKTKPETKQGNHHSHSITIVAWWAARRNRKQGQTQKVFIKYDMTKNFPRKVSSVAQNQ